MFAARPGIVAIYDADKQTEQLPVEAFDDAGVPYVLGPAGLIPASQRSGFLTLQYRDASVDVVLVAKPEFVREPTPVPVPPTPEEQR